MEEARLESAPLFAGLGKKERKTLATWTDSIEVGEGEEVAREGEFAYEFFVIEKGTAEVRHEGDHVADLGPGDFFGEMGILGHKRRGATVIAKSPMAVIVMTEQALRSLSREEPEVAQRLEEAMKERLAADGG